MPTIFGVGIFTSYFLLLFAACVSAEAATLFCAGVDLGLDKILLAFDATDADVRSLDCFVAICYLQVIK